MMEMSPSMRPHRRRNLLTGQWVLVSPQRMGRPWQGEDAAPAPEETVAYDPACYLCPGNGRVGGAVNPAYEGPWVFDNDFPALLPPDTAGERSAGGADGQGLLVEDAETGLCRVICYSPDHSATFGRLAPAAQLAVVETWTGQWRELSARPDIGAVTIFENRGAMMGASNPHPHGQIWATSSVPPELAAEVAEQAGYHARTGRPLLSDVLAEELARGERIVCRNDHFVVLVPHWAAWPFETLVLPVRPVAALDELSGAEVAGLAEALGRIARIYDGVFNCPFPCSMGIHQRPCHAPAPGFVLHVHHFPPLLRSASVRKHMVGFEMLAMPQRDITPEAAAARLREVAARIA
jgi:UDPglucose--hexose-1-phosphate uridylyltransferase